MRFIFSNHVIVLLYIIRMLIYGLPHKQMLKIYNFLIKQHFIKYLSRWLNSKDCKAVVSLFV